MIITKKTLIKKNHVFFKRRAVFVMGSEIIVFTKDFYIFLCFLYALPGSAFATVILHKCKQKPMIIKKSAKSTKNTKLSFNLR